MRWSVLRMLRLWACGGAAEERARAPGPRLQWQLRSVLHGINRARVFWNMRYCVLGMPPAKVASLCIPDEPGRLLGLHLLVLLPIVRPVPGTA